MANYGQLITILFVYFCKIDVPVIGSAMFVEGSAMFLILELL